MPPKIDIGQLPPPCVKLKNALTEMGDDVSLEGLRGCEGPLIRNAFDAYHRQLKNWWPETLYMRYNELPHPGTNDDSRRRQCLVAYLLNPSSGGFPADQPGGSAEDGDGSPLAKVRRVGDAGNGGVATPAQDTPIKCTPMQR